MPQTAAATTTAMNALPTRPTSATDAQVVTLSIKFVNGATYNPGALRTALATLGTIVLTDEGAPRPNGPFRFMIG